MKIIVKKLTSIIVILSLTLNINAQETKSYWPVGLGLAAGASCYLLYYKEMRDYHKQIKLVSNSDTNSDTDEQKIQIPSFFSLKKLGIGCFTGLCTYTISNLVIKIKREEEKRAAAEVARQAAYEEQKKQEKNHEEYLKEKLLQEVVDYKVSIIKRMDELVEKITKDYETEKNEIQETIDNCYAGGTPQARRAMESLEYNFRTKIEEIRSLKGGDLYYSDPKEIHPKMFDYLKRDYEKFLHSHQSTPIHGKEGRIRLCLEARSARPPIEADGEYE